jgi:hypothetical protein
MVLKIASVDSYGLPLIVVLFFMLDFNVAIGALVLVLEDRGIYSETSPAAFDRQRYVEVVLDIRGCCNVAISRDIA